MSVKTLMSHQDIIANDIHHLQLIYYEFALARTCYQLQHTQTTLWYLKVNGYQTYYFGANFLLCL